MVTDEGTIYVHPFHTSRLCCICDSPVFEHEEPGLCVTNGFQYLAHASCIEGIKNHDEEDFEVVYPDQNDTGLVSFNDTMS